MWRGWRILFPPLRPAAIARSGISTIKIIAAYQLFTSCIVDMRQCIGFSMTPTLSHQGDFVLISPLPYFRPWSKSRSPERGDLVFATSPREPRSFVCKRVIGVEGDVVEVEPRRDSGRRKWVGEDEEANEDDFQSRDAVATTSNRTLRMRSRRGEGHYIKVPKGHVWLVGDNLSNSTDSRTYGPVPIGIIKGKVLCRVSLR